MNYPNTLGPPLFKYYIFQNHTTLIQHTNAVRETTESEGMSHSITIPHHYKSECPLIYHYFLGSKISKGALEHYMLKNNDTLFMIIINIVSDN